MTRDRWITAFQYIAGLCDASTGLLLLGVPEFAARLMRVSTVPSPIVFLSYIGVFVLAVGLSYLWIALRTPLSPQSAPAWRSQWQLTALIRSAVVIFVVIAVATHKLDTGWALVALTDAAIAVVQWLGLYRGWLSNAS